MFWKKKGSHSLRIVLYDRKRLGDQGWTALVASFDAVALNSKKLHFDGWMTDTRKDTLPTEFYFYGLDGEEMLQTVVTRCLQDSKFKGNIDIYVIFGDPIDPSTKVKQAKLHWN
jgi:hypothetical protein